MIPSKTGEPEPSEARQVGTGRTARLAFLALALLLAGQACTDDADAPASEPRSQGPYSTYARQLCEAQAGNLDAGIASLARYGEALESEALDERATAVRGVLADLTDQSVTFLAHLDSSQPPAGDEAFVQTMRDGERALQDSLAEARNIAEAATSHGELDQALETVLSSFNDGLGAREALVVASDDLESALRTEPECAPLF